MAAGKTLWIGLWAAWGAVLFGGLQALNAYGFRVEPTGPTVAAWPSNSSLSRDETGATLLVFAHPKCPCTRATLKELRGVLDRAEGDFQAKVVFVQPESVEDGWSETDIWDQAAAIPGVELCVDRGGVEAKRFGAVSSGHCVLYDNTGALKFSGGLTIARGHEGRSQLTDNLSRLVCDEEAILDSAPTFGCRLLKNPEATRESVAATQL